jgi:hypothetical protein
MDLQGKVYNELGNLYSGTLTVTLYNDDTGATITGVTNPVTTSNGTWSFSGLGDTVKYRVEVASGNYKRIIVPGKVQHIDLQLTGTLDVNGNVTVGGDIVMASGKKVDGVDISELAANSATSAGLAAHAADPDAHHNKIHTHESDAEGGVLAIGQSAMASATSTVSTTSTNYVDLDSMSVALTTKGGRVLVLFSGSGSDNGAGQATISIGVKMDSAATVDLDSRSNTIVGQSYLFASVPAGSHTFKIQWKTSQNTPVCTFRRLIVIELPKQ